jgi:hypothetical protein
MKSLLLLLCLTVAASAQESWALRTIPAGHSLGRPAGKAGVYLIPTGSSNSQGTLGIYLRSTNGVSWAAVNLPFTYVTLACQNGRFVGCETNTGNPAVPWFTDNGTTYTKSTITAGALPNDFSPVRVAWGNNVWLIADSRGRMLRSTDNAVTWRLAQIQADRIEELLFAAGKFVAVSEGATLHSTDGQTWTIEGPASFGEVCATAGRFFSNTQASTDGHTWTALSGSDVRPPDTAFPRCAPTGLLTWSYTAQPFFHYFDGSQWTGPFASGVVSSIEDAALCGDLWISITSSGKVLTSSTPALPAPTAPALTISPAVRLTWTSQTGRTYVIQRSTNQTAWTDATGTMLGTGGVMEWTAPAAAAREFFRVQAR